MYSITMIRQRRVSLDGNDTIHVIKLSDSIKGGWYQQVSAKVGMLDRMSKRLYLYWHTKKIKEYYSFPKFSTWSENDEKLYLIQKDNLANLFPDATNKIIADHFVKQHESIWDFFDYINYDHSNKKVSNTDTLIFAQKRASSPMLK
jgi:hypothetical protein